MTEIEKNDLARAMFTQIRDSREEILRAFIAKHGIEDPAQVEQVTTEDPTTGHTVWFVRKRQTVDA